MIVDAHCHLWRRWPYPSTPPPGAATATALVGEMAANGVARAFVVAAAIGGEDARTQNPHNNDDVAEMVGERPSAFRMFADVDSRWSPFYHRPGSATRLAEDVSRTGAHGFTHYLGDADDGWFDTAEAAEFFTTAEGLGLVASVHAPPAWHAAIGALAERHPDLTLLLHHQGLATTDEDVEALIALAKHPRIAVKVSGFRYVSTTTPPYADVRARLVRVALAFGAERLAWGSDWPVSTQHHSYADALAFADDALAFFDASERDQVFGGTILALYPWRS
ncbi:amidohydrolase family protein [Herbiconiux ginsengi]|uniref:Predicted metal-dependent hydrolase, TIM-barrel fold n=1 Tax=Herbiconiux ginsengi TaxID=381665 RepID=A0A1H3K8S3_9MICO|nr:amidohydrolase family protein [Herbiconiux ginsengi]SDY47904.1 Predicted metal-dependent hydrolase, TIM-barrel fold [Herbiconiux ginsengi]